MKTAKVELEAVRSELERVQTELDKERHNSRNGIHGVIFDPRSCRASLTYNRQYQTTLDAQKAELECSHSELLRMRTELDAERDRSTKVESEVSALFLEILEHTDTQPPVKNRTWSCSLRDERRVMQI
jgi:hypothetical protein